MTTRVAVPDINSSTKVPNGFQRTVDKFMLSFPCIICENDIVYVRQIYNLLDFLENGEIAATKVRFLDAYQTGYKLTIVILDTKTGEMLKRSHRLDNDELVCDWVLTDLFTKPESEEQLLKDFRDRK